MGAGADSTSSFTSAVPGRHTSTALAAASDRSTMRSSMNGPRSVMRTMATCPVLRLVTRTMEFSGSVRCAAVMAFWS